MLLLRRTLLFLLLVNASTVSSEKPAISTNMTKNKQLSMDSFKTYGITRDHCVPNWNNSSKQDHHHCSRSGKSCPIWFICNDKTGKCQCGPTYYDNIRCDENKMVSAVMSCFCVTRSNNELYSGYCFYNCEQHTNIHKISNKVDLNKYMCGRFNRTGINMWSVQQWY